MLHLRPLHGEHYGSGVYWFTEAKPSSQPYRSTGIAGYFDMSVSPDYLVDFIAKPIQENGGILTADHFGEFADEFMNGIRDGIPARWAKAIVKPCGGWWALRTALTEVLRDVSSDALLNAPEFNPSTFEGVFIHVDMPAKCDVPQTFYFTWLYEPSKLFKCGLDYKVNMGNHHALLLRSSGMQFGDPDNVTAKPLAPQSVPQTI